jgi:hypothetical protein
LDLSMEKPSTMRSAVAIAFAPYDEESEGGQICFEAAGAMYTVCSSFARCSFGPRGYWPVSGPSGWFWNGRWPVLKI